MTSPAITVEICMRVAHEIEAFEQEWERLMAESPRVRIQLIGPDGEVYGSSVIEDVLLLVDGAIRYDKGRDCRLRT